MSKKSQTLSRFYVKYQHSSVGIFKGEKASIKNCKVTSISEEFLNQNQCFKAIYLS